MNIQQIFNKSAKHLLKQNKKSVAKIKGVTNCAYRGNNGLRCAIGCLISNKEYKPEMEGIIVEVLIKKYPVIRKKLKASAYFLGSLQGVHDSYKPREWKRELRYLASHFKLNADVVK